MMNNLKHYRERAGLTLTELGQKVGMSTSMICALEAGVRDTSGKTWKAIAKALDASLDELLGN